ncbi:hypothetical protein [Cellulophaga sp. Ld12]|uniref:hypothetical protein n=1 Tax=Cellulophaga sp. Ld12 TaxID=3229535 RepID=UPI003869306E
MNRQTLILGFLIIFISCKSASVKNESEFKINDDSINLYAFIGEKISIEEFDPNENNTQITIDSISGDTIRKVRHVMDYGFRNKFKVVRNVFNELKTDTIEFVAYDHYGRPSFEKYENVMLYISLNMEKGHYYHQKYQYDPVEKSKNGAWRGIDGKSIEKLFMEKKKGVLKAREIFD